MSSIHHYYFICPKRAKRKVWEYRPIRLIVVLEKVIEQLILDVTSKNVEENKVIRNRQHGFNERKLCLANLTTFCDVTVDWVDEEREVYVVYFDCSKAFGTVFYNILIGKLRTVG